MPLFTIATVTLNNLQGLEKTRISVEKQAFKDFEWLIQDGGSEDGTIQFFNNSDAVIETAKDEGIYDAMNRLIERARGDYILFLNAGDALAANDTLGRIAEHLHEKKPDFLYGDAFEDCNGKNFFKPARSHKHLALGMFTHHQSMLYRRANIGDLRYNLDYKIAADYDFTVRFLQNANIVEYINQPLCLFESGGISQQKTAPGRQEQFTIRKKLKLCSPVKNHMIISLQALNILFRRCAPHLFWKLKQN